MQLSDLKSQLPTKFYNSLNINELRPCQEQAVEAGVLDGKSVLVCSPTASGKTLVAEFAAVKAALENKGKTLYIVPLKSLATEKRKEFKEKYDSIGIKTALSIGDLDSSDPWLEKYDIIITTSEKADSLLRHGAPWAKDIAVVVADEIHLINDYHRGPVLEILLTLLRHLLPEVQIIGLSATIGNPEELADWLDAKLVLDDWRPVKLYQGIFQGNEIDFFDAKEPLGIPQKVSDPTLRLAYDTVRQGKQALIFCSTKKIAESTADKISRLLDPISEGYKLAETAEKVLANPTHQCKQLAQCLKNGVAFHHAGLMQKQKSLVEDAFRKEIVNIICCTPTLAMGVNLPAFRTIMKGLKRYSGRWGMDWIPILEYHQMTGRAGRP